MLKDIRDGDQAYWCHTCERGWRAGHLPPEARRAKAKALLEESLEVIPEVVIPQPVVVEPVKKPRASKAAPVVEPKVIAPKPTASKSVLLEPEVSLKAKTSRVAKTKPVPEAVMLKSVVPKVRTPRVAKPVLPEPVALMPEPVVKRRQPKVVLSISQPELEQKAVRLEPMPTVPNAKRTKPKTLTTILEPVTVLAKPKKQTKPSTLKNMAQLDLFA